MSFSEDILSQFDQYSAGNLSATEQQDFESKLKEDEEFRQMYEEYRNLQDGINAFGYEQLAGNIAEWEAEIKAEEDTTGRRLGSWYLVAASISVILVAVIGFWALNDKDSTQQLYSAYYEAYPDVITSRAGDSNKLKEALYAYESEAYVDAELMLKELARKDPDDREAQFYLAQTLMARGKIDEAKEIFHVLKNTTGFSLREASAWYLALSYLKMEKNQEAKEELQKIIAYTNHAYGTQARELIKKLN